MMYFTLGLVFILLIVYVLCVAIYVISINRHTENKKSHKLTARQLASGK